MRIFYEETANCIVIEGYGRLLAQGSLIAIETGNGRIGVKYKDVTKLEIAWRYEDILKEDGSQAGSGVEEVITYLNNEFLKGRDHILFESLPEL